jgi:hypothetical protein
MPALRITLEPRKPRDAAPDEVFLEAAVVNEGPEPVRFNADQAAHPSLVLEVEGPSGQRVRLPPPPPPTERELGPGEPLAPGSDARLRYAGFLDPALGPGRFRARYFGDVESLGGSIDDPLASEWVEFELPRPRPRPRPKLWPPPWPFLWKWLRWLIELIIGWLRRCKRVYEQEVDEAVTQTISDAPPGSEAWNGTYGWRARFLLRIEEASCRVRVTVRVRVTGTLSAAQQSAWESAIESAWTNIFKLCCGSSCCPGGYRIEADIQFVTSGEHQVVTAGAGTVSMGLWGAADTVDVRHEFGHMLGALDEYFTVNGVVWGAARQPAGAIMNNPANAPVARHYELIRTRAQALRGGACSTEAVGNPC